MDRKKTKAIIKIQIKDLINFYIDNHFKLSDMFSVTLFLI